MNKTTFETNIKKWVLIDNEMQNINNKIKKLRDEKNDLEKSILNYVEENKINNSIISISDSKLRFINSKQSTPLSFKFIENCLNKCISNKDDVENVIKYIKSVRPFKYNQNIKRIYNNES